MNNKFNVLYYILIEVIKLIKKQLILYCIEKCKFLKFFGLQELKIVNQ